MSEKIQDSCLCSAIKVDTSVDSSQAPHVLVFQVGTITIFVDFASKYVFPGFDVRRNVKLGRTFGILRITDLFAVYPDVHRCCSSFEMKENLTTVPIGRNSELMPVGADRIILLIDKRGIFGKWISHIGIDRRPIAVKFPIAGNFNLLPLAVVIVYAIEIGRAELRSGNPVELPVAV